MSNLIVPNASKIELMKIACGLQSNYASRIKLFSNNHVPGPTTVAGSLVEATFTGYSFISLSGVSVSGSLDMESRAVLSYSACTWTKSGATGNTIYGYWVSDAAGVLLWVERFDSTIPMVSDGAYLVITPAFTGMSQYANS